MNKQAILFIAGALLAIESVHTHAQSKTTGREPRFIDNGRIRLGVDLESGASIFFFARSDTGRNLLNHADRGRFVQQSWYGRKDGSLWAGKPWRWNPVQGGDYKGRPAQVLVFTNSATQLYAESIPVNWAGGEDVKDARMEEWISLEEDVAHIRFRFRWNGGIDHPPAHQELPAVFVDYALPTLVHYAGSAPWTGAALTNSVPGWPNESRSIDECWAAFVDQRDWGIGVYVPGQTRITTYRHPGKPGPTGGGCSYFAPVATMTITNRFDHSYDVYITIGTVDEIRGRFAAVRAARQKASK